MDVVDSADRAGLGGSLLAVVAGLGLAGCGALGGSGECSDDHAPEMEVIETGTDEDLHTIAFQSAGGAGGTFVTFYGDPEFNSTIPDAGRLVHVQGPTTTNDGDRVYAVAEDGAVYMSSFPPSTWSRIQDPVGHVIRAGTQGVDRWWVAVGESVVLLGGEDAVTRVDVPGADLWAVDAFWELWAVGSDGVILRSDDGLQWEAVEGPGAFDFRAVAAPVAYQDQGPDRLLWVGSEDGRLWSRDGDDPWHEATLPEQTRWNTIVVGYRQAWVAGEGGLLARTVEDDDDFRMVEPPTAAATFFDAEREDGVPDTFHFAGEAGTVLRVRMTPCSWPYTDLIIYP